MKTILVPTDLSTFADSALQVAADLARTNGAIILLVHYLPFSLAGADTPEGVEAMNSYLDEQEAFAKFDLQQVVKRSRYQNVSIIPVVCRDEDGLFETITKPVGRSDQVDLLVLATHGASGWNEWLFGSNAEHIVRFAHCPVLVIKQAVTPFAPKNIIAAIDVDDLLKQYWPLCPFDAGGNSLKQFVYVSTPSDKRASEGVHAWMHELAQQKGIVGYELHIRYARTVEEGILNYAHERQADLIVLYTHGHTGLRHLVQGSVAEDVLNHAPVPVLVLRLNNYL